MTPEPDSTFEIQQRDLRRIMDQHEPQITVVHTGESFTLLYNPATHEEVRNETADGNVILTVQPKGEGNE